MTYLPPFLTVKVAVNTTSLAIMYIRISLQSNVSFFAELCVVLVNMVSFSKENVMYKANCFITCTNLLSHYEFGTRNECIHDLS